MKEISVSDWMHRGVVSCQPDMSVEKVSKLMGSKDISALVVVNREGDAVGVISRTDLVNGRFIQPYLKHWRGMTAAHLMSVPVVSVSPMTPVREAARLLKREHIHRLVVVEGEGECLKPVGILSVTDLSRHVSGKEP